MHGAKKPGGTLYNLVLGRAIGKGIDFNDRGVRIGVEVPNVDVPSTGGSTDDKWRFHRLEELLTTNGGSID